MYKTQNVNTGVWASRPESCVFLGLDNNLLKLVKNGGFFCIKPRPWSFSNLNQVPPKSKYNHEKV